MTCGRDGCGRNATADRENWGGAGFCSPYCEVRS